MSPLPVVGSAPADAGSSADAAVTPMPGDAAPRLAAFRPRGDPKVERACSDLATTFCRRSRACAAADLEQRFGDEKICVEKFGLWCLRELAADGSGFSLETLRDCGNALNARSCKRWRRLEDLPIEACHPRGERRYQEPCFSHAQCVSGFCSRAQMTGESGGRPSACGVCAPVAAIGDVCGSSAAPVQIFGCPLGAVCSRGLCIGPMVDEGEECGLGAWYTNCYGESPQDTYPTHLGCTPGPGGRLVCEREQRPLTCKQGPHQCWGEELCNPDNKRCERKRIAPPKAQLTCSIDEPCSWPADCIDGACLVLDPQVCDAESKAGESGD